MIKTIYPIRNLRSKQILELVKMNTKLHYKENTIYINIIPSPRHTRTTTYLYM